MASYIESVLGKDEAVQYQARISLWNFCGSYLFIGLGALNAIHQAILGHIPSVLFSIAFMAAWGVYIAVIYNSTELAITNKRIISKQGFIRRDSVELNLSKVESIRVSQDVFGRLLNYGSVRIVGSGSSSAPIPGISAPIMFRRKYDELVAA